MGNAGSCCWLHPQLPSATTFSGGKLHANRQGATAHGDLVEGGHAIHVALVVGAYLPHPLARAAEVAHMLQVLDASASVVEGHLKVRTNRQEALLAGAAVVKDGHTHVATLLALMELTLPHQILVQLRHGRALIFAAAHAIGACHRVQRVWLALIPPSCARGVVPPLNHLSPPFVSSSPCASEPSHGARLLCALPYVGAGDVAHCASHFCVWLPSPFQLFRGGYAVMPFPPWCAHQLWPCWICARPRCACGASFPSPLCRAVLGTAGLRLVLRALAMVQQAL